MTPLKYHLNAIDKLKQRNAIAQAIEYAEDALIEYPDSMDLLKAVGICCRLASEYEKSEFYLRRARELYPESVSIANELAMTLAKMGRSNEAKHLLCVLKTPNGGSFRTLALILEKEGDYSSAQKILEKGQSHCPESILFLELAFFYLRRHNFESFRKLLDGDISEIKNSLRHTELLATAAFMQNDTEKAKRLCRSALWGKRHLNWRIATLYMAVTEGDERDCQRLGLKSFLSPETYQRLLEHAAHKFGPGGVYAPVTAVAVGNCRYQDVAPRHSVGRREASASL